MDFNSTITLEIATAFLAEVIMYLTSSSVRPNVVVVAPRAKSVCSFVSLVQTNLGTKFVCSLVTKRDLAVRIWTILVPIRLIKRKRNGFGPFS